MARLCWESGVGGSVAADWVCVVPELMVRVLRGRGRTLGVLLVVEELICRFLAHWLLLSRSLSMSMVLPRRAGTRLDSSL